ncbi:hypothetical protein Q0590_26595 [Rhodocytophaga aerolata]|uniref:LysM domain-containing protein n=1 Tax=Rhodocytophaga aerolata TaxID=455078 RepID=A0ABT8RGN9_9BACT|nr:hypothetical protein [Rhodocytophaga aerolata]MDO1449877.1 hypothetical protein [Rhodocytophaga aerolata]
MNRLYITLLSLFIAPILLHANDSPDYWYRGTVYLKSGESLDALLQYNQKKDYLLLMQESGIKAYNAGQIDSYEVFDPVSRIHRTFYPLPFSEKRRQRYQFFELLQPGVLNLLSREVERIQDRFMPNRFHGGMIHQPGMFHHPGIVHQPFVHIVKVDEFYVLDKKGQMHEFNGSKKELLALMADKAGKIEEFIRSRKLDLHDKTHLKAVFRYYNALQLIEEKRYPAGEVWDEPLTLFSGLALSLTLLPFLSTF